MAGPDGSTIGIYVYMAMNDPTNSWGAWYTNPVPFPADRPYATVEDFAEPTQEEEIIYVTPSPEPSGPTGLLTVNLNGVRANIFIDDTLKLRDQPIMFRSRFPTGSHVIRIEHPNFITLDTTITLGTNGRSITLFLRRKNRP